MPISLKKPQIDAGIPQIRRGLGQYLWLQSQVMTFTTIQNEAEFRRKFNHFYRVRRSAVWQDAFYQLMDLAKKEQLKFHIVLTLLHKETGRYEASFTSKLVATLHPSAPIIDSVILRNIGLRLPYACARNRANRIRELYERLAECLDAFLKTEDGKYLVREFRCAYPCADTTEIKMLDLVLWQTRPN